MTTDPYFIRFPRDSRAAAVHKIIAGTLAGGVGGWRGLKLEEITKFWNVIRQAKIMGWESKC